MESDRQQAWVKDLHNFILYWEKEVDTLKEKKINPNACNEIVEVFHRDRDMLLCRRPSDVSDEIIISQLSPLASKLDSSLAMALCQ